MDHPRGGDGVNDVNLFDPNRNDIPTVSSAQSEVFRDWSNPAQSGRQQHQQSNADCVTIHEGNGRTIYAQAGSTINIYEGDQNQRVGGGRNSYMPNYDDQQQRYAENGRVPYRPINNSGYDNTGYAQVSGRGYEEPYRRENPVGNFFGRIFEGLAVGAGIGLTGRLGGHGFARPYPIYERPYTPGYSPVSYDGNYYPQQQSSYYPQNNSGYYTGNGGDSGYYPPPQPIIYREPYYGGNRYDYGRHRGGGNFLAGALTGAVATTLIDSSINNNNNRQNYPYYGS